MGKKVNPRLLRLGIVYNWNSLWFEEKKYKDLVLSDFKIRKAVRTRLKNAGVSDIEVERSTNSIKLTIYVSRPGMVIGRGGSGLEELKNFLYGVLNVRKDSKVAPKLDIRIEPIKEPSLDAYLVSKNIAEQLIKRVPHRRAMAWAVERVMNAGAKGVRILLSGRVGGAEIGRREKLQQGTVPLSTLRANISYSSFPALTKKGYIGVKVWINRGEK